MGMFKDMRTLQKQAKEISKDWDPGAQARDANTRMAALTQSMAAANAAAATSGQVAAAGQAAQATITAVRETGMMVNMQPVLHLDVLVMADGRPPFPASSEGPVSMALLGRLVPGAELNVRYDPANTSAIAIDWATL
jgi:hypothetical protein